MMNARRREFCRLYVKYREASRAYAQAFGARGASAHNGGSRLMSIGEVREQIARLEAERDRRALIRAADILLGYKRIAQADPKDFMDERGNLLPIHKLPRRARLALAGFKIKRRREQEEVVEIRLCDRKASYDALARYTKMPDPENAPDRLEVTGGGHAVQRETRAQLRASAMDLLETLRARAKALDAHNAQQAQAPPPGS